MLAKYVLDKQDNGQGSGLEGMIEYNTSEVLVEHTGERVS